MFRNLTIFRFHPDDALLALLAGPALAEGLAECALKPVGPLELSSRGWVPLPNGELFRHIGDAVHLVLGGQDKILPPSAVNAELDKRLAAIEEAEGQRPAGRTRKRLKDEVVTELLPRALVKPYRLEGYLDLFRGLAVVDTASRKAAEGWVSEVRRALGSFPALPLNAEVAPRSVLTDWLVEPGCVPNRLHPADECQLREPVDEGGIVGVQRMDLQSDEVERHLEAGKQVTRLGLFLGDRITFTLGEDLVVRKLKFLDGALEDLAEEREDAAAEFDARATLLAGEVGALFDVLEQAFRISKVEG